MGAKKGKKPAPPAPDELRRPIDAAAHRRASRAGLLFGAAVLVTLVLALNYDASPLPFAVAAVIFFMAVGVVRGIVARGKLAACRALLDHEHWEPAVVGLKELQGGHGVVADEATYLVALAYDRQDARKLALESFKAYLQRFKRGVWAVEARVRVEELEAAQVTLRPLRPVDVELHCPFCKSAILADSPVAECGGCGTAHHAGCYEEQGGCAVYGCESKTARARVRA